MSSSTTTLLDALAATRRTSPEKLHQLDQDDVSLSHEGLAVLRQAVMSVLPKIVGGTEMREMSFAQAVKLFSEKIFWNESDGGLILCGQVAGRAVCIPIAAEHWAVAMHGTVH